MFLEAPGNMHSEASMVFAGFSAPLRKSMFVHHKQKWCKKLVLPVTLELGTLKVSFGPSGTKSIVRQKHLPTFLGRSW